MAASCQTSASPSNPEPGRSADACRRSASSFRLGHRRREGRRRDRRAGAGGATRRHPRRRPRRRSRWTGPARSGTCGSCATSSPPRTLGAPVLVVSQFTLYGDARKGRRPTWKAAAPGRGVASRSTRRSARSCERLGATVARGRLRRGHAGGARQRRPGHGPARAVARQRTSNPRSPSGSSSVTQHCPRRRRVAPTRHHSTIAATSAGSPSNTARDGAVRLVGHPAGDRVRRPPPGAHEAPEEDTLYAASDDHPGASHRVQRRSRPRSQRRERGLHPGRRRVRSRRPPRDTAHGRGHDRGRPARPSGPGCAASTRPAPAKNRKCPVAEVGTSAVNSPVRSSRRT